MSRGRASEPRSDAWIDGNWRLTPSTCPPSPLQGLHGGVIASLVDTMGSLALASRGMYMTGVSIDMSQTFVRGAKLGQKVRVESEVVNMGKTLAYTRVELLNHDTGKLLAYGSHTKYIADAIKSDKNVKFSEDGETILEGVEPTE
ncbi:hypothetical protein JCM8202v2_004848 [Rhodotorula sphaerocarpa]